MNGKLKAIVLLGVMYILGAVSGAAWQNYRSHRWEPMHAIFAEHRIKRLTSRLHLSPAQDKALRDIFEKAHARATQINEEVSWDLADVHHDSVEAIRKVLTPDQLQEFDKMHHKFHDRYKHMPADDLISPPVTSKSPS